MAKIIPSLLKMQNSLVIMRQSTGVANFSANYIRENIYQLRNAITPDLSKSFIRKFDRSIHENFSICFNNVNFKYPESDIKIRVKNI